MVKELVRQMLSFCIIFHWNDNEDAEFSDERCNVIKIKNTICMNFAFYMDLKLFLS
jgi:hypothetical protein